MLRVFYHRRLPATREFNWALAPFCVLHVLLSFTGYLLPWDQLGIWRPPSVPTCRRTPFVGEQVRFLLIGGYEISDKHADPLYVPDVIAVPLDYSRADCGPASGGSARMAASQAALMALDKSPTWRA